jgi:hypothetical protein
MPRRPTSVCSQLLVFVPYVQAEDIKGEFFVCASLFGIINAVDILEMAENFPLLPNKTSTEM